MGRGTGIGLVRRISFSSTDRWVAEYLHVDTDLAGLELALEAGGGGTRAGEDSSAITVLVGIDQLDGIINSVDLEADQDRTKDLLAVASHVRLYASDNGWGNPVTIGVLGRLVATAIEQDGSALFLSACNQLLDASLALRADDRTQIGTLLKSAVGVEGLGTLSNLWKPLLGLTDHDKSA